MLTLLTIVCTVGGVCSRNENYHHNNQINSFKLYILTRWGIVLGVYQWYE